MESSDITAGAHFDMEIKRMPAAAATSPHARPATIPAAMLSGGGRGEAALQPDSHFHLAMRLLLECDWNKIPPLEIERFGLALIFYCEPLRFLVKWKRRAAPPVLPWRPESGRLDSK